MKLKFWSLSYIDFGLFCFVFKPTNIAAFEYQNFSHQETIFGYLPISLKKGTESYKTHCAFHCLKELNLTSLLNFVFQKRKKQESNCKHLIFCLIQKYPFSWKFDQRWCDKIPWRNQQKRQLRVESFSHITGTVPDFGKFYCLPVNWTRCWTLKKSSISVKKSQQLSSPKTETPVNNGTCSLVPSWRATLQKLQVALPPRPMILQQQRLN